ncbi:hypothetical protein, partial [Rickettsiella grylli]|uniref:hypothetical protein n=1 Tax=Rickettsiella grylli TaxID=59196 RepID=UPI000AE0F98C
MARFSLGFLIGVVGITQFSYLPSLKLAYILILMSVVLFLFPFFKHYFLSNWSLFFVACCL